MSAEDTPDKLEPILYRVLYCSAYQDVEGSGFRIIPLKTLLWLIGDKPPNFFQQAVRHLFLVDGDDSDVDSVLKACNHVTNLFAYFDPTPYACTLSALQHLRRLAIALPPKLTHLELMDANLNENLRNLGKRLPLMPNLTHLALNSLFDDLFPVLYDIMRLQTTLQRIVVLDLDPPPINTTGTHPFADDDRFVCIHRPKPFRLDWLRGALTGNYWAFADVFIPARRARKVDGALAFYGVPNFL
ncbi:hypothetical protein B0H14DRAFT_3426990 [Mycena olivaceomarginata]|nr:hypothetical protein B0H14DRAFT_3426990 [Mycena olivaceomarginata]